MKYSILRIVNTVEKFIHPSIHSTLLKSPINMSMIFKCMWIMEREMLEGIGYIWGMHIGEIQSIR